MKSCRQLLAVCLALCMLLPVMVACGKTSGDEGSTTVATTLASADNTTETVPPVTEDPTLRKNAKDNLPDDLNFGNATIRMLSRQGYNKFDMDGGGEITGDLIFDAVYSRNLAVEERLGIKFETDVRDLSYPDYSKLIQNEVAAGDDNYAIIFVGGNASIQSGNDFLFYDLHDAEYLDFDQPWWSVEAMQDISLDGVTMRYLVGDITLSKYLTSGCVYFNKDIYANHFGDADDLYKLVLDGKWTWEQFRNLAMDAYTDLNGDGVVNEGDIYGSKIGFYEDLKLMEYGSDLHRFTRDEATGYVKLDYDVERAVTLTQTLYKVMNETKGVVYVGSDYDAAGFADGKEFFYIDMLRKAAQGALKDMQDEYGIIPMPKLDETQEQYHGLIQNGAYFTVIPKTVKDVDRSCAVIEALCAESYRTVTEKFYEVALKLKYSRDSYSGQCIDIISSVSKKNVLYEYNAALGGGFVTTDILTTTDGSDFASYYNSKKTGWAKTIELYMKKYEKNRAAE